jgi:hypothetical protein
MYMYNLLKKLLFKMSKRTDGTFFGLTADRLPNEFDGRV